MLISHAATPAMRARQVPRRRSAGRTRGGGLPLHGDERIPIATDAVALSSPAACALDTAHALGLVVRVAAELADMDYGQWRGRRLADIDG